MRFEPWRIKLSLTPTTLEACCRLVKIFEYSQQLIGLLKIYDPLIKLSISFDLYLTLSDLLPWKHILCILTILIYSSEQSLTHPLVLIPLCGYRLHLTLQHSPLNPYIFKFFCESLVHHTHPLVVLLAIGSLNSKP